MQLSIEEEARPSMSCLQWRIYLLTLSGLSMFAALLSAFGMVKESMQKEFGMSSSFFGIVDGASFLGRTLGSLCLLKFPVEKPTQTYAITSYISFCFLALIPLASTVPSLSSPLVLVAMFCSGFFRSYTTLIYLMLTEQVDIKKHKKAYNIWNSLLFAAEPIVVFSFGIFLNEFSLSWNICFAIFLSVFLIDSLLIHALVPEISMQPSSAEEEGQEGEYLVLLREYFQGRPHNIIFMVDALLSRGQTYMILMWFPYYYSKLGFESITLISMCYFFTFIPTPLVYETILERLPATIPQKHIALFFLVLSMLFSLLLVAIEPVPQNTHLIVLTICLMGFAQSGPANQIVGTELMETTKDNVRLKYYLMTLFRLGKNVSILLFMLLIGFCIDIEINSILYILFGTSVLNFLIFAIRKYCMRPIDDLPEQLQQEEQ